MKNVFLFLLGLLLGCSLSLFKVHTTNNVSSEFVTKYKFKGRVDQNSKFNFMLYDSIYRSVYQSTTNAVSFIPKSIEDSGAQSKFSGGKPIVLCSKIVNFAP